MNIVLQKVAAFALGSTVAGGLLVAIASSQGVDLIQTVKVWVCQGELGDAEAFGKKVLDGLAVAEAPNWAGNYIHSGGFESRHFVLGTKGFFYEYSHCTGTGELAYGEVEWVKGDLVRLKPDFHVRPDRPQEHASGLRSDFWFEPEVYVVRWSGEQFLVPASKMPEFCRLAKAEKWSSMQYADYPRLRHEDGYSTFGDAHFEGLPDVPAEFRHLLPVE